MVAQWQAELDRLADRDELEQKLAAAIQSGTPQRLEASMLWNAAALEEKLGALQKHIARLLLDGHTSEEAMRAEYGHVLTALPVFLADLCMLAKLTGWARPGDILTQCAHTFEFSIDLLLKQGKENGA